MGYPTGFGRGFFPTHNLVAICLVIVSLSLSSVSLLFTFRYLTSLGLSSFRNRDKVKIVVGHGCAPVLALCAYWAFENQEEVFLELNREYSCITADLASIPDFLFYRSESFVLKVMGPASIMSTWVIWDISTKIRATLNHGKMSEKTARLHKKFLYLLILQVSLPACIVLFPLAVGSLCVIHGIQAGTVVSLYAVCSLSIFSLVGGIVLILTNEGYRSVFNKCWKTSVSSLASGTSVTRFSK